MPSRRALEPLCTAHRVKHSVKPCAAHVPRLCAVQDCERGLAPLEVFPFQLPAAVASYIPTIKARRRTSLWQPLAPLLYDLFGSHSHMCCVALLCDTPVDVQTLLLQMLLCRLSCAPLFGSHSHLCCVTLLCRLSCADTPVQCPPAASNAAPTLACRAARPEQQRSSNAPLLSTPSRAPLSKQQGILAAMHPC